MAKFTVDTHIFRELGELLVGRDSTALIELIKNAYDADATEILVYGEALDDPRRGFITITDNGTGMTESEFENGFLRVASRLKEEGSRVSKRFGRRYTGAKGIGRLAAHKLARLIQVHSIAWNESQAADRFALDAIVNWDEIEKYQTLDDLITDAILVELLPVSRTVKHGTQIKLERLRRRWTSAERGRFLQEVDSFDPPSVLIKLPKGVVEEPLLFEEPLLRDSSKEDTGFRIKLEGEFAIGEDYWVNLAQATSWVIEIDARHKPHTGEREVQYAIAPTRATAKENPQAETRRFSIDHPDPEKGPFFQARILVKEWGFSDKQIRDWATRASGIRTFIEGFRVLPYGDQKNDWLGIDADYVRRQRSFRSLTDFDEYFPDDKNDVDAPLVILPNRSYYGAVFLIQKDAPSLRMLVNREGFVPEEGYNTLVELVRKGVDLSARVRAYATRESRAQRRAERAAGKTDDKEKANEIIPTRQIIDDSLLQAKSLVREARQLTASGDIKGATARITDALNQVEKATQSNDRFISEESMIRVLASVGTQLTGFVHEINGLIGITEAVDNTLARIRQDKSLSRDVKQALAKLHGSIGDLRRGLEKQASYFVDIVTPDARRRRARLSIAARFDTGAKLVAPSAERKEIQILNEIPDDLKSPRMFPAELTAVFSNLLTNAVKAAGVKGKIRATAECLSDESIKVLIENTGVAVNLADSERWFKPFESTTENVDPILGQGMGMGLPITRNLLEEYGATIKFVKPSKGYSTASQIVFPP
jgi:signal transduction histidine kinase